jgi:hypothetical protein
MGHYHKSKLEQLTDIEGFDSSHDLLSEAVMDSICPGICMNEWCDYTTEVEPDQDVGWCEVCQANTVASALILAGVI